MVASMLALVAGLGLLVYVRTRLTDPGASLRTVWQVRFALAGQWFGVVMIVGPPVVSTAWYLGSVGSVLEGLFDIAFIVVALLAGLEIYRRGVMPLRERLRTLREV